MNRLILVLTFFFFADLCHLQACIPIEQTEMKPAQTRTLFYVTSRKKAIRLSTQMINNQPYFNFFVCDEYRDFSIEKANDWDPRFCRPISSQWIPVVTTQGSQNLLLPVFTEFTKEQLQSRVDNLDLKNTIDPAIASLFELLDSGIYGGVGFGLQFYAKRFTPTTRTGKIARGLARSTGWFLVATAIIGGGFDLHKDLSSENIYEKKLLRLNQVINDIDEGYYFNETSPSQEVLNILEIIEESMKAASDAVLYAYCTN